MVHLIHAANRTQHAELLESMFHDRRRVFVDGLKWPLAIDDHGREIDDFDTPDALYLVDAAADGLHRASVRLLPTARPHLLASHFEHLVHDRLPSGPDTWEITRFCASPGLRGGAAQWAARKRVLAAMIEYAMLHDITRLVFVTHGSFVPRILSVGWDVKLLGLPYHDAQCGSIVAMVLRITPATLQLVRASWGLTEAMLVLAPQMAEAA